MTYRNNTVIFLKQLWHCELYCNWKKKGNSFCILNASVVLRPLKAVVQMMAARSVKLHLFSYSAHMSWKCILAPGKKKKTQQKNNSESQ